MFTSIKGVEWNLKESDRIAMKYYNYHSEGIGGSK